MSSSQRAERRHAVVRPREADAWVRWLRGFGLRRCSRAFVEHAQDAERRCVQCDRPISLDVVPDLAHGRRRRRLPGVTGNVRRGSRIAPAGSTVPEGRRAGRHPRGPAPRPRRRREGDARPHHQDGGPMTEDRGLVIVERQE